MPEGMNSVDELLSHAGWLRGLACRLVGEAGADDAIQEVWLKAARRPLARIESPRGWLRSALRSVHLRRVERQGAAAARERAAGREGPRADALSGGLPSADELAERAEAQRLLVQAVLRLGEPDRQTVLLHFFEGLSAAEIARRSGVPSSTVRTRIARGVRSLRDGLDQGPGGDHPGGAVGRAAWVPAISLLVPPSGGLITPSFVPFGLFFMWKLGALLTGLALILWTGLQFLDEDAETPPTAGKAPVSLPAAPAKAAEPIAGQTMPPAAKDERAPAGDLLAQAADLAVESPATPSQTGPVITGQVVDPNGQPVPGATVYEGTQYDVVLALRSTKRNQPNTKAGDDGRFSFDLESDGGAILCAHAEGFAISEEFAWDPAVPSSGEGITMRLRRGAAVTGVVYGKDQQPIPGRTVMLASSAIGEFRNVVTGEAGRYRLEGLTPGPWRAATFPSDQELLDAGLSTAPANAIAQAKQAEFTLVGGETVDVPLGLVSEDAPRVRGTLLHEGKPISCLMQWSPAERPMEKMVSQADEAGRFEVDLPSPGAWIVHANATGASSRGQRRRFVFAAGERRDIEIDLRGGRILGKVVDDQGEPIKGVMLEIRAVGTAPQLPAPTLDGGVDWSDKTGSYEFGLLLPGDYVVIAHGSRPTTKKTKRGAARSELLTVTGTEEVVASPVVLREGTSFGITVTQKNGRRVTGASLYFHDSDGHCLNPLTKTGSSAINSVMSPCFAPGPVWVTAIHHSGASQTAVVRVGTDAAVELVIAGEHWIEMNGGAEWLDQTKGHLSVIDADGRRWNGFVDMRRLFEAPPKRDTPRGPMLGPLPHGSYTVTYVAPGITPLRGTVELRAESPQVSVVPLR